VVVPVALVGGVPVAFVEIVDVVAVQDALMSAVLAVPVLMTLVRHMPAGLALVPVPLVLAVQMPVVRVVDVVLVGDLGVTAVRAVGVRVGGVFVVEGGHGLTFEATGDDVGQAATGGVRIGRFGARGVGCPWRERY
jgi:hypothetical protein